MYKRCCVIDYVGAIGPKRVVLAGPTTVEAGPGKGGLGDDFLRVMAAVPAQLKDQLLPAAESAVASGETAVRALYTTYVAYTTDQHQQNSGETRDGAYETAQKHHNQRTAPWSNCMGFRATP